MRKAPDQTGSLPAEAHTLTVEQIRRALISFQGVRSEDLNGVQGVAGSNPAVPI